jgi:hypothetical protein
LRTADRREAPTHRCSGRDELARRRSPLQIGHHLR